MSLHSGCAAQSAFPSNSAHKHCTRTAHPPTRGYGPCLSRWGTAPSCVSGSINVKVGARKGM
eukprot:2028585-Prymnesium_polylepis.1